MEKENVIIEKDGVNVQISVMGTFESNNGNEYLVYRFDDKNIDVSKIVRMDAIIQLVDVPEEDDDFVNETLKHILEEE